MPAETGLTRSILRWSALIAALRDGPLARPDLLARLGDAYPRSASARPMVDRDIRQLALLGIAIEISRSRPPVYTLRGGAPALDTAGLRALALIRDTFGDWHPQSAQVRALLDQLAAGLRPEQLAEYARRQSSRAPLQPAIDYTPHAATIARLELAISRREIISFDYTNARGQRAAHQAEPYEIEYYERHFYLVAYHAATRQLLDYRVDRVAEIATVQTLPEHLSRAHERRPIVFRYRLAADLARGEISRRFEKQRVVERLPSGDAIVEAEGRSDFFIVQTLLRYRANAELLAPGWLREKMAEEVRALAGIYIVPAGNRPDEDIQD
ncbi:MAG: WYL domain-containing protein [Kouleothrix sp.]|nr:WYL domain-containing protein [Kouleothrix sp.]